MSGCVWELVWCFGGGLTQDTTAPILTELECEGGSLRRNLVVG
jgi:hypothetical protein